VTRASSLGTRLLAATVATAFVIMAALVGMVAFRANHDLAEQAVEVSRWSEEQLSRRLKNEAQLAAARLELLREDVARRFAAIAQRADLLPAISSGNTVEIAGLLQPAIEVSDLDGAIAFNAKLQALGSHSLTANLLLANRAILESALASSEQGGVVDIIGRPLFDEFGDVDGVLLGYRKLRRREPALDAFAALSGRDLVVRRGIEALSVAGRDLGDASLETRPGTALRYLNNGKDVARCHDIAPDAEICTITSLQELKRLTDNLIGMGRAHTRTLLLTLAAATIVALLVFAGVSIILARRITRPLVRITRTMQEVAQGNLATSVVDGQRPDEVGDIARVLTILKRSVEERDQLRETAMAQNHALLRREEELNEQNQRFDAALNNMSQGLCMFDADAKLKVFNDRLLQIYGLAPGSLVVGDSLTALSQRADSPPLMRAAIMPAGGQAPGGPGVKAGVETVVLPDGRLIEVSVQAMAEGGWVETHEDVTESHTAQARIVHMAMHDTLTGLPNRVLFLERLVTAVAAERGSSHALSVLCLDMDDFKSVNDSLGHAAGDDLLKQFSARLRLLAGPDAMIARLGGDEFAIIQVSPDASIGDGAAVALAAKLIDGLKAPYWLGGTMVVTSSSIGVAAATPDIEDADHLLRRADLALNAAKSEGRGRYAAFERAMEDRLGHRRRLERDLREALATGKIEVHYQPLVDLAREEICGFEALARWPDAARGMVSPGEFIPLAEEVGLIDTLGEYVLLRACQDALAWPDSIAVSVNVSPIQFRNADLQRMIVDVLGRTTLPANRLELEITESVVLNQDGATHEVLHGLRGLGIRFAMDDFGTGFSSLSSLKSFPFDKIKLDQSFVRDAAQNPDAATIVRIVADLGRSLAMATTAEGVETKEQLESLRAAGFTQAQGYLFSPAVPPDRVAALIARFKDHQRAA
jgi:diguanylate cyclase (GGDEF)-like protein